MKQFFYQNNVTGEIMSKKEALSIWCDEYDGNDPTNDVPFNEIFTKTDLEIN